MKSNIELTKQYSLSKRLLKSTLTKFQEIKNVLERQRHEWMTQRKKLMIEQESLEERETVHVAASVYLVGFYQETT